MDKNVYLKLYENKLISHYCTFSSTIIRFIVSLKITVHVSSNQPTGKLE